MGEKPTQGRYRDLLLLLSIGHWCKLGRRL